jgi:hypothetical protein
MESAINVCVDKGFLRVVGEIQVVSSREELEAFVSEINLKLLGNKKMSVRLPSFGVTTKELTETDAAVYIGRSKSFLRKCRLEGNIAKRRRGPKYTRDSSRCIRYPVEELDMWLAAKIRYEAVCEELKPENSAT